MICKFLDYLDILDLIPTGLNRSTLRPGQSEGLPGISPAGIFQIPREADFALAKSDNMKKLPPSSILKYWKG